MYYDNKKSGKRIQQLRKDIDLTQEQLADNLNISHSTMGRIERGSQGISIDLLIEVAAYFGVSLDYILLGREMQTDKLKNKIRAMMKQLEDVEKLL